MEFKTFNPYNGEQLATYTKLTEKELTDKLDKSQEVFSTWRKTELTERIKLIEKVGALLREKKAEYAKMISQEMGKPVSEAEGEVNKCAWLCDYYAENVAEFLKDEVIESEASKSFVSHSPIGTVFAVMPWNFPFWQVFRFAIPTLVAGNVGLLKHASNVFGSAALIEEIFTEAGFPDGVFQNLFINHDDTETVIKHPAVKAITLTGSEKAGSAVAALAGKHIKKSLLELGGNNAYIVLKDADIDKAVEVGVVARMLNAGQSCIAAKRFILEEDIYEEFVTKFTKAVADLKSGDPLSTETKVGPLARKDLAEGLQKQVQDSIAQGAELLFGGKQEGAYHEPTILGNVTAEMTAFKEETFGPLAAMVKAKDIDHAFELAQDSIYGLGLTIFTADVDKAIAYQSKVADGAYFINEMVKSDPRLPFGGTKLSGYGRELSKDGMMEFMNRKTVFVK